MTNDYRDDGPTMEECEVLDELHNNMVRDLTYHYHYKPSWFSRHWQNGNIMCAVLAAFVAVLICLWLTTANAKGSHSGHSSHASHSTSSHGCMVFGHPCK